MDIFNDLKSKNYNYSDKIESNKYTQSTNNLIINNKVIDNGKSINNEQLHIEQEISTKYKSIYELILSIKDNEYQILEMKEKDKYVSDKKIVLCSNVDDEYNNYNFNKRILSKSLICSNLQKYKDNLLSLILFYNDYFKINLIIYHDN